MTSICIIACYFGKLPEYFKFWYKSCQENKTVNFIFITDQLESIVDNNIEIINMNIIQLETLVQEKIGIEGTWLKKPYKICDFRPAFGIIFKDYLKKYEFWGHCDIDQIFGNIRNFITEDILNNNDRVLSNGNLSLYRNNDRMNNLYKESGSIYSYQKVFSTKENYAFDEFTGINKIIKKNEIKNYYKNFVADIEPKYSRFKLVDGKNYKYQIFYYENGEICRIYLDEDNNINTDKFSHIHFQKRKMPVNDADIEMPYYITKNGFIKKQQEDDLNTDEIMKYSDYVSDKRDKIDEKEYIKNKIKTFLKCNFKQKIVWIKQKISR